jgi:Cu/Ag efflux pump CusA
VLAFTIAPVLALTGLQGAFFSPLALAFLLAVLASLLVAICVTPALALLLLGRIGDHTETPMMTRMKNAHGRMVAAVCQAPQTVLTVTVLVGVLAILGAVSFGSELLPAFRERHYVLQVGGPAGASLGYMRDLGKRISHDLLALPAVASVEMQIGRAQAGEDTFPPHRSEFHVELRDVGAGGEDAAMADIRRVLARYPGLQSEVLTFLGDRIGESLSGETAAVAIGVYGADLDTLDRVAAAVAARLRRVPGAADVQIKAQPGAPEIAIDLDPAQLALRGVTASDAHDAIETAFQGRIIGQSAVADRVTDIALTLAPSGRDPEAIGALLVRAAAGTSTRLDSVAKIRPGDGRLVIDHDGGRRRQIVTANPVGRDVSGFVAEARVTLARDVPLPPGVYLGFAGAADGAAAATRQLAINVGAAAIAIAALLVLAFGGGRPALLIVAGTPFALAGGVLTAWLGGGVLSLGALVGFVTLFGIAARNAILLIAHVDHLVAEEGEMFGLETVLRATRERLVPIMMTALVTMLGLLPLALEAGQSGREVQGPMAAVILGGLFSATVMSLVLLPALVLAYRHPIISQKVPDAPAAGRG